MDEYRNILPKSININRIFSSEDIKPILDSLDHSILSFSHITVYLNSVEKLEQLLMVSSLAKSILLYMNDRMEKWDIEEVPPE